MAKQKKKRRRGPGVQHKRRTAAPVMNRTAPAPVNPMQAQMRVVAALERAQGYYSSARMQTALQTAQNVAQRVQERRENQGGKEDLRAEMGKICAECEYSFFPPAGHGTCEHPDGVPGDIDVFNPACELFERASE